jgi:hypothetical protein
MLSGSPITLSQLSQSFTLVNDPTDTWLYFLKEKRGMEVTGNGYDTLRLAPVVVSRTHVSGSIKNLARESARACTDCAANEAKQQP